MVGKPPFLGGRQSFRAILLVSGKVITNKKGVLVANDHRINIESTFWSLYLHKYYEANNKVLKHSHMAGVMILPTQTMHIYIEGKSLKSTIHVLACLMPSKMGPI